MDTCVFAALGRCVVCNWCRNLRLLRLGFRSEGPALNFASSVWLERFVRSRFALVGSNGAYGLRRFCTGLAQVFGGSGHSLTKCPDKATARRNLRSRALKSETCLLTVRMEVLEKKLEAIVFFGAMGTTAYRDADSIPNQHLKMCSVFDFRPLLTISGNFRRL